MYCEQIALNASARSGDITLARQSSQMTNENSIEKKEESTKLKVAPPELPIDKSGPNYIPPRLRLITPKDIYPDFLKNNSTSFTHIGTTGKKLTFLPAEQFEPDRKVEHLSFRSNLIREISSLGSLLNLVHLELYENKIKTLDGIETLINLKILDVSYNRIRELDPKIFYHLINLEKLYVAQNKLTKIEALEKCTNLRMLDLGMNKIEKIEGLNSLSNLEELWLGKNKISRIENLASLEKLSRLDIQSNRLTSINTKEINLLKKLKEIFLSHQGIIIKKEEEELELNELIMFDLSANKLDDESLEWFKKCSFKKLEDLWLGENDIQKLSSAKNLQQFENLDTVYFEHNPISKEFQYRIKLKQFIPSLTQIDATRI
eukprot:maker-scaffold_30-snap-gene-3.28-mRNA-1 protein AED:0.21 eAED:0.21 QI:0/0/0/0.33/1/1/3/0/374